MFDDLLGEHKGLHAEYQCNECKRVVEVSIYDLDLPDGWTIDHNGHFVCDQCSKELAVGI